MSDLVLLVDFGSTFTKVLAVDTARAVVLGRSQAPTTVTTNLLEGLLAALDRLTLDGVKPAPEVLAAARKVASSSAAGGLRIVAVGLVPDLTVEAARKAALGAGAKVVGAFAFELDDAAIAELLAARPDLVLLTGGIDGGNKDVLLHNARALAQSALTVPVVVAGNRSAAASACAVLEGAGKIAVRTDNVLPELDRLVVEPARGAIRDLFMANIVKAKGLADAQAWLGCTLMPTPAATLQGAALVADGVQDASGAMPGLGELMVVEIGGATTNVHSIAAGAAAGRDTLVRGLPDPYAMRTVEGDLGIRYNATTIVEVLGPAAVLQHADPAAGLDAPTLLASVARRHDDVTFIPDSPVEAAVDIALARAATEVAVSRHAGTLTESWSLDGPVHIQRGKDLRGLQTVIGAGGIFAHHAAAARILEAAVGSTRTPFALLPRAPAFYLDRDYVLYAVGLLATLDPTAALRIARRHLLPVAA